LKDRVAAFARERDWDQYHSPKNLSMALTVEAGHESFTNPAFLRPS